jgi:DNA-binding transcriptional MerR regulator
VNAAGRMQIGEVAERIGLSLRTIRYEDDVERLRVIMQMKPLGFSLEEMRELLELLDAGNAADQARMTAFREQAAERVATLRRQLRTAEEFAARLG